VSSNVFPSLSGLTWPFGHSVSYKSLSDESQSKRLATLALQTYPVHTWTLNYDILRDDVSPSDIRSIVGLFNACRGRYDSFLFTDPTFNSVSGQVFGVGDGNTKNFQVVANFQNAGGAGGPDIIQNFNGLPTIFDNGGTPGAYSIGPTGIIAFTTAPAAGHVLTWTGSFYYRCHFLNDTLQVQQFANQWWSTQNLQFRSVLL
jgi:hypothetical protein